MHTLRAGDHVLAMDEAGRVFSDRVMFNAHVHDTRAHDTRMLELHHDRGVITLTPDHALFVDGRFGPASAARVGSTLLVQPEHVGGAPVEVHVTHIQASAVRWSL
jgi:hypothetical protein